MQLVEQGQLDLDEDINSYLDFEIPASYPEPITLRHLLSHSAGFEDRALGIFVASPAELMPDSEWLPANLPARVRPAGEVSSYSNYGAALAGYIVEHVSGEVYDDYIEGHILEPLGMSHTSTRQPLTPALADGLSLGYVYTDGRFEPRSFEVLQTAPGGSASSTATDMAAFMIAHLQDGRYGSSRILSEATAQQMHSTLFTHDPRLHGGYAYGFAEAERNGLRIISHGGDTQFFHSQLMLVPSENIGLFVAYNTLGTENLPGDLTQAFLIATSPPHLRLLKRRAISLSRQCASWARTDQIVIPTRRRRKWCWSSSRRTRSAQTAMRSSSSTHSVEKRSASSRSNRSCFSRSTGRSSSHFAKIIEDVLN